jgi:diguanylate cyclase (GGDEF)-like protein
VADSYATGADQALISLGIDEKRREYEVRLSDLPGRQSAVGRLLLMRDVTERARLEEGLRQQALTDSLTGLANRTLFMSKLQDAVHSARRHPDRLFAAIILDLDRFKLINDTVGHPAGDAVLEGVAARLSRCVREVDTVARLGGDEFMILLDDISSTRDVIVVLERIQEEMKAPIRVRQQEMTTSASMGVVIWDASYHDPEDLMRAADTAMYEAKESGGACYRIFDERMHRSMRAALEAEDDLRTAVRRGDFMLEYQPVIDVRTSEVCALEALVRWQHPRRGRLEPPDFITIAENSGLIVPLGELIIDQVCGQIDQWRGLGHPASGLPVSLNISPRQLTETDFVGLVLARTADWRLPPEALMCEVTESALIRDPVRAGATLKELCDLGIRVCLDDYGAGWSSLQHLLTFPGQELKLDRTLASRVASGETELAIVRSVTGLAHVLGLTVTAEGVESAREWELLEASGCDRVQGYYCGRPVSSQDLQSLLEERRSHKRTVPAHRRPYAVS